MNRSGQALTLGQVLSGLGALALLAYGAYGVWIDDLVVPTKRSAMHLSGLSAWLMGAALLCGAANLVTAVAGGAAAQSTADRCKPLRIWGWRGAGMLAGLSLGLHLAGVRFPQRSQVDQTGVLLGLLLFVFLAAMGWAQGRHEENRSSLPRTSVTPTPGMSPTGGRIVGLLLLVVGVLLVLPPALNVIRHGQLVSPVMVTLGIALASLGAWMRLQAGRRDLPPVDNVRPGRNGTWLPLQIGAVLILCVWASVSLDLSPRESGELGPAAMPQSRKAAPAPTLESTLVPAQFRDQTRDRLVAMMRAEGHAVRCYGDLKGQERIAPSITQVCVVNAGRTWGLPVEDVSFHFAGEVLQMARYEFAHDQWPNVQKWFLASEGQDVGTFGQDGKGNKILGRHVANGLLQTAPPSRGGTVMMLWEARSLVDERCGKGIMEPWQKAVLCDRHRPTT